MATIIYDTRLEAVLAKRANQVHHDSSSEAQSSTDDMSYVSAAEASLLFKLTDPELYAFLNGGAK